MTDIVEINARDLAKLQKLANSGEIAEKIWNDPEHGMKLKALVKEALPDSNIPELEVLNQTNRVREEAFARVDAMAAEITKLKEANKARDDQAAIDREEFKFSEKLEAVRKSKNFTEAGMQKVLDRMKEHNNPDVESAAAWVLSQEPKIPTQPNHAPQTMDVFGSASGDQEWAELNANPGKWYDKTVTEILNDPQYN